MWQVVLPSALVGGPSTDDPEVKRLHTELKEVNRKVLNNELDIPPESERSPSPEPVYDRSGIRLNTRCALLAKSVHDAVSCGLRTWVLCMARTSMQASYLSSGRMR